MSKSPRYHRAPKRTFSLVAIALVALCGLGLALLTDWNPFAIWILSVSVITFLMYGYDKAQAQQDGPRIPEIVLHGLALAGGFLGGWLGRAVFHHKIRKPIFTLILAVSTVIYIALAAVLFL